MNCDGNNLLQEDLTPDDVSAKSRPDDAENNLKSRKRKTISSSEFDKLQSQVKGVSDVLNNFGEIFRSFLYEEKAQSAPIAAQFAPIAAQSAPIAAQSAPIAAQSASTAAQSAQSATHAATPSTSFQDDLISATLSSPVANTSPYGAVFCPSFAEYLIHIHIRQEKASRNAQPI